jgi:2-polyprenyl-6-hydroxyphenyl methylase / 3-demethylubiquinone-9 3-methyltransferase
MTWLARWRRPPPARRNDVAVYEERADAWWSDDDPIFLPLRAMARPRLRFLERALEARGQTLAGKRVADVGAGGGIVSLELAARGARVVALDLSPASLRAAVLESRRRAIAIAAVAGNAEKLPLGDGCVDLVVCADVLVQVPDRSAALDELARLCAPGGFVYIATMNRTALARFVLITLGEDVLGIIERGTHDPGTFVRPGELAEELARRGLSEIAREGVGPVGIDRRGLIFGRVPTTAVMYHALFERPARGAAPLPR